MKQSASVRSVDLLVAEYVAGTLAQPAKILVDAHLEIVPESYGWVQNLEAIAGHSLDISSPEAITNRDSMIEEILEAPEKDIELNHDVEAIDTAKTHDEWMPACLRDFIGVPTKDIPWRMKIPGVHVFKIDDVDDCEITLLRIKPGGSIPTHTHEGRELTLVLKGSFDDGEGDYGRGDISIADQAIDHKPVAGMLEECICLVINDAPVRFTGPVARVISSIFPR